MSSGEEGLIGIPFPEHSSELLSHLNDQRRAGLLCDLTLTSRGARYPTHRSVMAAVSLYFRQLFGSEEGGGGGAGSFSVCQLDCVAPDALDALLEFAYTATLTIPSSGMRDVLQGAQVLGIQCVADACRDILGETAEAEPPEEPGAQHAPAERAVPAERPAPTERLAVTPSRRKTDRKRIKSIRPEHATPPSLHPPAPPSPILQSSPVSDSFHSLPSTQPPSPEPHHDPRHNGDPHGLAEEGGAPALNGGFLHWYDDRPLPPPDRLSEDDEVEGFGDNGAQLGGTPTALADPEQEAAAMAMEVGGIGRKRKSQMPQQCPVCQKIIHGAGKLPRHMRTHTGEKPFQCITCGVRFTRNDKLKIHMRKHTGERPYICPHCPARFLHSYDLKNHLSLHSGARPFECPLCHKAFAREDHLQRHRKGHSCLEVRTRRPRHGPDRWEGGVGGAGGEPNPLEAFALQAHPPAFLAAAVAEGGMALGPQLVFPGDSDRGRALALQALAQLGPHRLACYPELIRHSLDLRMGREAEPEDPGRHRRDCWADGAKEENGETEAREEE